MTSFSIRRTLLGPSHAILLAASLLLAATTSSHALTVYDPSNHAQNILQASRALDQIANQVRSLQNEAQMLINQARNLENLPHSSLQEIVYSAQRTHLLLGQAQNIAYDVDRIDRAFQGVYGTANMSDTEAKMLADAMERWRNTLGGIQDSMRVQATIVGNLDSNRSQMSALVQQSQGAIGSLQATQAGNQLMALQTQQIADLTALVAADSRAQAMEAAERAAAVEQGRELRRRFLVRGAGYQFNPARMFPTNP